MHIYMELIRHTEPENWKRTATRSIGQNCTHLGEKNLEQTISKGLVNQIEF